MRALDFALATTPLRGKSFARSSKLQWLVAVRGELKVIEVLVNFSYRDELSPDSRSVSSCSSDSNTDELPVTQRESFKRVRRGPGRLGGGVFFVRNKKSEWVSEWERERGSTDGHNWRLLDCNQDFEKVRAHSVSLPTGIRRFPIVGKRTLVQKLARLGYNSTPRPDATRALPHMPWL